MRRHALGSGVFLFLVACSSFSSTASDVGTDDGGAAEGGTTGEGGTTTDAATDTTSPTLDAGTPMEAGLDAGDPACTVFDRMPSPTTGWATALSNTGESLTIVTQDGRSAVDAHIESAFQRAALVHDVSPGLLGNLTIETDFIAATSAGSSGSLVELLVLECTTPALKIALEVAPDGALFVESTPGSGVTALGAPTATWRPLKLVITGSTFHVELAGTVELTHTMTASFGGALGCTLAIGAKATAGIGATTAYYSGACIR